MIKRIFKNPCTDLMQLRIEINVTLITENYYFLRFNKHITPIDISSRQLHNTYSILSIQCTGVFKTFYMFETTIVKLYLLINHYVFINENIIYHTKMFGIIIILTVVYLNWGEVLDVRRIEFNLIFRIMIYEIIYMLDLILSIQSVCLPISCGNSSQAIATDMDMPVVTFSENAAPIDIPSIMLCRLSPNRTNRANKMMPANVSIIYNPHRLNHIIRAVSWNTAELDNDPVAKPKRILITVFFRFGSLTFVDFLGCNTGIWLSGDAIALIG
ncbi:hypothetical protein AGLY_006715 [Aphis glycines]|uniref:Uncharacterized protein n=1 Tax=Aphis glycines TaxID=307491 RepID=A0A6G0TSD9_APHGL|nr:hypothetical protein AGLY_006715 [Aphis glycines]